MGTTKTGAAPDPASFGPTIEELAAANKVKPWVMAGVMKENTWAAGKRMPEEDFLKAVESWLKSPMSGRKE
jgi:hypothetical protein